MISINATTQPATIPQTSLPSSSFCSCLASIEGDVAITSVLELIMKFIPPIEVILFTLVAAIELVLDVRSEVIILVEIILAVETEAIITSVVKQVELTLLAVTTHEIINAYS